MRVGGRSDTSLVAPEADVEAVREAESAVTADVGEPGGKAVELRSGAALGHQQNPIARDLVGAADGQNFREIPGFGHDELEPCFRGGGKKRKCLRMNAQGFRHRRVGEFWRDVELVDRLVEIGTWDAGAVGFHLELVIWMCGADGFDEGEEVILLEQGLAAGDDRASARIEEDFRRRLGGGDLEGGVFLFVF